MNALEWAFVVVLLLLAIAGIWHIGARLAGYKVLPMYQPRACGGAPHQLAYITEHERHHDVRAEADAASDREGHAVQRARRKLRVV